MRPKVSSPVLQAPQLFSILIHTNSSLPIYFIVLPSYVFHVASFPQVSLIKCSMNFSLSIQ
jgi:hypothetical protein